MPTRRPAAAERGSGGEAGKAVATQSAREEPPRKAQCNREEGDAAPAAAGGPRVIRKVGFLGISDFGLGQLRILASRYKVVFATAKWKRTAHAEGLSEQLATFCHERSIEYLGAVDANSTEVVERAKGTDLLVIGGYDRILRQPVLEAPRYGVLNTHLGVLPLNRGCCPSMWAQLHDWPQGFTTYRVGTEVDFGAILDLFQATLLGGVWHTNRDVYDSLAGRAVENFAAALDKFERGDALPPCTGREAYHRQGMPNNGWLSFHWSNAFLRRFSLALDFKPYLPGRTRIVKGSPAPKEEEEEEVEEDEEEVEVESFYLAVLQEGMLTGTDALPQHWAEKAVGEVLASEGEGEGALVTVRTREGAVRCRLCDRGGGGAGQAALRVGAQLESLGGQGKHAIDVDFAGAVLPAERYLCEPRST